MIVHNSEKLQAFYKHDKMNVAIVSDIFYPTSGGVTTFVDGLARAINKSGKANAVVITGKAGKFRDTTDNPVIRCSSFPIPKEWGDSLPLPKLDCKFKKLVKKLNIDVLDIHTVFGVCTYFLKFAKKNNIPVVFQGNSKFSEEYPTIIKFKPLCKKMYNRAYGIARRADLVVPVSHSTCQNYTEHGVNNDKKVMHPGTDMYEFTDMERLHQYFKEKHGIDKDYQNVMSFVSRLEIACKNIDFMLESLKIVKDKGLDYKMFILGTGTDVEKIKKMIVDLDLSDRVFMVGEVRDRELIAMYYKRSYLHLYPSVKDAFPLAKLEAASQGAPTVAIENTGTCEGMDDLYNGYVTKNDVNAYAQTILDAFNDRAKHDEISQNTKQTLGKHWDKVAEEFMQAFTQLVSKKKSGEGLGK
jgi:1,2-diacylglycerol 3-alpha-glucosyltransferase